MKITEGYNVSFCWCFPKVDNNTCEAYCYAYVREFESGNCIYAGVKYEGSKFDLKKYKCHLRKTAIERLLKKPIFCITPIGENLKNLLDHKNKRLNGIDMQSLEQGKKAKYSTVLAKTAQPCLACNSPLDPLLLHDLLEERDSVICRQTTF